MFKAVYMC